MIRLLIVAALAVASAGCVIPGRELLLRNGDAAPGVEYMIADGANVRRVETSPRDSRYHTDGTIQIAAWTPPDAWAFYVLHEVCHAWQDRRGVYGITWIYATDEGRAAAALGMTQEAAADVCALYWLGAHAVPAAALAIRIPGYGAGAAPIPDAWAEWYRSLVEGS